VSYWNGNNTPQMQQQESFGKAGMRWRVLFDFGASAIDWRAMYQNPDA